MRRCHVLRGAAVGYRSSRSQRHLNAIALRLNQRPRKTLGFETPADRLQAVLHQPVEPTGVKRASRQFSSWSVGAVCEPPHTGSPPPVRKATKLPCHSLNQATRRKQFRNSASQPTTANANGSNSVCGPASIAAIRHRARRSPFCATCAQAARKNVRWNPLSRFVCLFQVHRSRAQAHAADHHDGRMIYDSSLDPWSRNRVSGRLITLIILLGASFVSNSLVCVCGVIY
jgi:hypothetical protein